MVTTYDVPAKNLIDEIAEVLKKEYPQIVPPDWIPFVRSGVHKEHPPQVEDFWYIRCSSILRKLYIKETIGISRLRTLYGGRKRRGPKPPKFRKGSGSIIRKALHQLEDVGLVASDKKKGRSLTAKGRSLLDRTASKLKSEYQKE